MKRFLSTLIVVCMLFSLLPSILLFANAADASGTAADAQTISVNKTYSDNISDGYDQDYFKFTLTAAGTMTISFTRPYLGDSQEYWTAVLYNDKTEEICRYSFDGVNTNTTTYLVGLSVGTYYIRFAGGDVGSSGKYWYRVSTETYSFCLNYTQTELCEKENNDSVAAATTIEPNKTIAGSVNDGYDQDYYRFRLTTAGTITISFTRPYLGDSQEYWTAVLYNEKTEEICRYSFDGVNTDTETYLVGLSAGTYYIRFAGGDMGSSGKYWYRVSTETYSFCLNYTQTELCEKENNDSVAAATAIELEKTIAGSVNDGYDQDYYKFSLSKAGTVCIGFSSKNLGDSQEYWTAVLYDVKTSQISKYSYSGNTQSTKMNIELPAGVYYVRIAGGDVSSSGKYWYRISTETYYLCIHLHDYVNTKVISPTCTEQGYTIHTCACGDSYVDTYVSELGHSWDAGIIAVQPTETQTGIKVFTCRRCGSQWLEEIPMLSHVHSYTAVATLPTCTERGYTTHTCSCGDSYRDTYVNALGHNYVSGFCTRCGAKDPNYKPPVTTNPFRDVKSGEFYYNAVLWAVNANPQVTSGTSATTFSPSVTCTRAQVVTFLWRAKGCPEPKSSHNPFRDVKQGEYFYKAVLWAVENNVTSGTSATTFSPSDGCTRAQVVTFLWRVEGQPKPASSSNPFRDVTGGYYYDAVLWAVEKNVTSGTSATTFSPNNTCTRGQIVTFLYRVVA